MEERRSMSAASAGKGQKPFFGTFYKGCSHARLCNTKNMKENAKENIEIPALIAMAKWLASIGRSNTTGWRWAQAGWIHPINIAGRPYLNRDDIAQFISRAEKGEFSKSPNGACRRAHEQLKDMEEVTK